MTKPTRDTPFKPTLSRTESKAEAVSRIAMSMIEQETAQREAKTERLKLARLEREAAEATTRQIASEAAKTAPAAAKTARVRVKPAGKAAPAAASTRSAG